MSITKIILLMSCLSMSTLYAGKLKVQMYGSQHEDHGWIEFEDARDRGLDKGLLIRLNLWSLPPNTPHGFHIHEIGQCDGGDHSDHSSASTSPSMPNPPSTGTTAPASTDAPFMSAGGHWGPGTHQGPYGNGHLGDLPLISSDKDGRAMYYVIAPNIQNVELLRGRAVMLHAGGDTYTDPPTLGGGGARMACGVVPYQSTQQNKRGWRNWWNNWKSR